MLKNNLIFFMPQMVGGGVEKNLYIIANSFAKKIKNVYLITSSKNFNKNFKNIKIINPKFKIWNYLGKRLNYLICLLILIREISNKKNPVVFAFQANIYCIVVCKLLGIKIITRSNTAPAGWTRNIFKNFIFKIILSAADKIIVNSYEFQKDLKKKFNVKAVCIYNPLNIKEIKNKSKININLKYFKKNNKLKILNIGRLTDQKDHLTLLRSVKILKNKYNLNFILLIISSGQNEKKIKKFIIKNNLNNEVKVIKFQKNPYRFIKHCNLFVLSSLYEGLPNVLLEALTLKKFVISSNCPTGPNEILSYGRGGFLFKIRDHESLAKKMVFYFNNKKILNKKINFAYKNLNRFDYNKSLEKYYAEVTNLF